MGVLLVCLVAVILLQLTEGKICDEETEFTFFDSDNPDAEETCQKCQKCQPGQGLAVQCGSRVPYGTFTGCKKCEVDKTYSENNDISDCKPCNQCGLKIVLRQCTPTQNSKCANHCIAGYKLHPIIDACQVVPGTTEHPIDSQVSKQVLAKILGGCLGGVVFMVFIGFIIYFANKRRHRSQSCKDLERGSVPADNEQSTGDDNPNLDVQRISEERVVSDMEWLRDHSGSPMLFQVQNELDAVDTIHNKAWRSVGRALGVTTQKLNLIETCYKAGKSPTEELVEHLKTRGNAEPKMRTLVMALIACKKIDLARIICNWPWEVNQGNDSN